MTICNGCSIVDPPGQPHDCKTCDVCGPKKPEVGDVFVETWGYDQTNVDFYEVVAVTKASVRIKPISAHVVDAKVMPAKGAYRPPTGGYSAGHRAGKYHPERGITKRLLLSTWGSEHSWYLNMTSYSSAYPWDGTPQYDTLAAGHPGH